MFKFTLLITAFEQLVTILLRAFPKQDVFHLLFDPFTRVLNQEKHAGELATVHALQRENNASIEFLEKLFLELVDAVFETLGEQETREWIDDMIDPLETRLEALDNVLGVAGLTTIKFIRNVMSIPDDIGGDED